VILLRDNARLHVAKVVKDTLSAFQWKILPYAAYSPDCTLSDHLSLILIDAAGLADQHFKMNMKK